MNDFSHSFKMDLIEKLTYQANGKIRNNLSEYQRKRLGHGLEDILSYCKFRDFYRHLIIGSNS